MKNILGVRIETTAKYPGICRVCKVRIQVGEPIVYYLKTEAMEHLQCFLDRTTQPATATQPGKSNKD